MTATAAVTFGTAMGTVAASFAFGVVVTLAVTFVVLLTIDRDTRRAAAEVALALLFGPAALLVAVARRGPRMRRLSPRALELFARMQEGDERAWLLSYGGRGVILVRRRSGERAWRSNVPNRAADAADLS
jgi:hypothetical protein